MDGKDSVIGAELRSRIRDLRQTGEGEYVCGMGFDPAFRGFEGHFEGNPIVPGVCMIEAARVVAETILGQALSTRNVSNCRFRRPILAGETAEIRIELAAEEALWKVQFVIRVDGGVCAQLQLKAAPL